MMGGISSINGQGKLDIHVERMKLDPYITYKTNLKMNVCPKRRPETKKLLEENIGGKLFFY